VTRHSLPFVLLATVALAGFAVAEPEPAPEALALGSPAPASDVKMKNIDGKEVSIADVHGKKGTLVVFTCNACPWARAWEKRIAEIGNSAKKQGIGVIAINSNDPDIQPGDNYAEMKTRAKTLKITYPYVVDASSDVARAFGASRTPEIFLFDADGKLVYRGTVDDNAKEPAKVTKTYLKDAVTAVASGKTVEVADTKAFGCGIKFRPKSTSS
jgi:peroxiredoxin